MDKVELTDSASQLLLSARGPVDHKAPADELNSSSSTSFSQLVDEQPSANDEARSEAQQQTSRQSAYDVVVGANDQELARRQYSDDDADDVEAIENGSSSPSHKRLATEQRRVVLRDDGEHNYQHQNSDETKAHRSQAYKNQEESDVSERKSQTENGFLDEFSNGTSSNGSCELADRNSLQAKQQQHSDEREQMRKLFIGGLDYKTSEETLKKHFEKFGDVIDCVVMREPQSKRSRGFGFVIYANSKMVDRAQEARPHEVDGREVQSKRAVSREDSGKPEAQATVKKVYLGGLSDDIEEAELRDYFKEYGNIVNINIVAHKDTGKRRGFAFVEYDDYDPVDKIVSKKFYTIKNKRIEAKKAIPKVEMDARKRVDPQSARASAMIALSGPPLEGPGARLRGGRSAGACLWDDIYGLGSFPAGYSGQPSLGDGYPPHYHSPISHYGAAAGWMLHGGFRGSHGGATGSGAYGRNGYPSQVSGWTTTADYGSFAAAQGGGGAGPMRLSYQHRSWRPYGNYGTRRGYNP